MRQKIRLFVVFAVVALLWTGTSSPPTHAAPGTDIWTHYYDCALQWRGTKFRGCDSTGENWGELNGHFKEVESCSCGGTTCTTTWYEWDPVTGRWYNIGGEPAPDC